MSSADIPGLQPSELSQQVRTENRLGRVEPGDVWLSAGLLAIAILSGLFVDAARPDTVEPATWWQWFLICLPPVVVVFRRIDPAVAVAIVTIAQALVWIANLPEVLLPVLVVYYTAACDGGRRGRSCAAWAGVALTGVTLLGVFIVDDVSVYQVPLIALTCATAIYLGRGAATQRRRSGELAVAASQAELRAAIERDAAVARERTHIGRELHDSVGHTLSMIAVSAEAASRVAESRPEAAQQAVRDIGDSARAALDDVRRVLAGLEGSSTAELAPPTELAAIEDLVSDLAVQGVAISLRIENELLYRPATVVVQGAYRIVQEAVTNALRHGSPDPMIEVDILVRSSELCIKVVNSAHGSAAAGNGTGLTSMAERARILGGSCESYWETPDRFAVTATLPNMMWRGRR